MTAVTSVIRCVQNQLQIDCRGQIPDVSLTTPVASHYSNLCTTRLLTNKSLERAYFQISKGKPRNTRRTGTCRRATQGATSVNEPLDPSLAQDRMLCNC